MKYQAPVGAADPNDPYVTGDPASAVEGSAPTAEAIEHPQREIVEVITQAGLTPNDADLTQLHAAIVKLITDGVPTVYADMPVWAGFDNDGAGKDLIAAPIGIVTVARPLTLTGGVASLVTAATGADLILDIEKNGVSVFTTQPQFDAGTTVFSPGVLDEGSATCVAGDVLRFFVDQVGSTVAGQELSWTTTAEYS